ncbi:coiled-coil protein [Thalictrum thalictroides]|uniref:Coiled-coil protein n=1 Tax=Thalictrum thalictroides TaxID=46969 RepID=A0A7J6X713_THATH|nr:coiled-coil protein [Thalictrum thalictroides]
MESGEEEDNWSEAVEDLVDGGNIEGAISLLESTISKLETLNLSNLKLSSALTDLANLYSSQGFSTKADELQTRAFLIKQKAQQQIQPSLGDSVNVEKKGSEEIRVSNASASTCTASESSDDDWEAVADRGSIPVISPQIDEDISKLSMEDTTSKTPKRRGRGSFLYKKNGLYSDQEPNDAVLYASKDEDSHNKSEEKMEKHKLRYGTNHVLVLADFPPSTRTIELEKLYENYRDSGVVIRWVNDTVALAVFRTPSIALEACNATHCPFTVRCLSKDDSLLCSISIKDLEPPVPRPKTSARTAQRMIAQGMGQKLSTTSFGSCELRKQEEARRNRIVTRQNLREDAWGADD